MPRPRHSTAQALVESALVLPVLVVLALGVIQIVLYVHAHDVLTSAVQEGARLAAEDGRTLDDGYGRARALVVAGLGNSADSVHLQGSQDAELVTLEADARLRPILPGVLMDDLPLRAVGRVARERFRPAGGRP